jgi:hypothetical protein
MDIEVAMVDGVIMVEEVIMDGAVVDGGRDPILASTSARLTPPTDTMRILHMGITDTRHTGTTTDTRIEDYAMARQTLQSLATASPLIRGTTFK